MNLRIKTAQGKGNRIIAGRIFPGSNMMEGIAEICRENNVKNGYIASCIGSLKEVKIMDPIKIPEKKAGYGYGDPILMKGPIELLSAAGFVCHSDEGEIMLHVHAHLADERGNAYGGHLTDDGNIVLLTVDVLIHEIDGIDMVRKYDDETELPMFSPK